MLAFSLLLLEKMAHIILASSSPRRQELLKQLGLEFESYAPEIDESVQYNETVEAYVERLAREKQIQYFNSFRNPSSLRLIQV